MKGHLSCRDTLSDIVICPLKTGFTIIQCAGILLISNISLFVSPDSVATHLECVTRDQKVPGSNPVWVAVV